MAEDYCAILGVSPDASAAEIREAYRRLARQCHPDHTCNDPEAEQQFLRIQEAYEMLCEPERRRPVGAFHTPLSAFLTVRCLPNSIRREGLSESASYALPALAVVTALYLLMICGVILMGGNAPAAARGIATEVGSHNSAGDILFYWWIGGFTVLYLVFVIWVVAQVFDK